MKKLYLILVLLILGLITTGLVFSEKSIERNNNDYLRIHIRANSNSEVDQKVKYLIKDEFVNFLTPKLAFCGSKEEVISMIDVESTNLENLADTILAENGFSYTSKVKINREMFPTRTYDGLTLESGIYDALIVELGHASGNNWWCVIYPPLCFTNYSNGNFSGIVYKSKILEIIRQFFS